MRINLRYVLLFLIILGVEIVIALVVHDNFVRPHIGDVLVVIVIYCFLRIFVRAHPLLPLWIFAFAAAVEFSQYFNLVSLLGIKNPVIATILGATFDWLDLLCYAVGCGIIVIAQMWSSKREKQKNIREQTDNTHAEYTENA